MLSKVSADEACIMPGFQHYVSGVPEPFCRSVLPLPFCRCRSAVAGVPFPLPFRAEATELDGNHFPLTMNVKQSVAVFAVASTEEIQAA